MKTETLNRESLNPASAFFASPLARGVAALLRLLEKAAPQAGTRLALRLFLTPLPTKLAARAQALPPGWRVELLPFEHSPLAVWRRREPGAGAPVLLVHGWGGSAAQLLALAEAVAAAGYEPLIAELPAHGRAGGWRSNLLQWTRALFALSSRYGGWHAVIGHSLGARALAHALARGLPARRAVLLATAPPPRQFLGWFASAVGLGEALAERMASRIEQREGGLMQGFEPAWIGPRVAQAVLLLHDRGDRSAPLDSAEQLAAALPRARLRVTDGLGHRKLLAAPAVLREVAGFLQD